FFLASKKFKFNPKPKGASAKQNPRIFPSTPAQAKPFARTFGMGGQPREMSSNKELEETLRKLREQGL
ncbi:MAG: hypothetical protein V1886_04060, partial [archaeon]